MKNIDWKAYKESKLEMISENVCEVKPKLVIIQVGDNSASNVYVGQKEKAGVKAGIEVKHIKLSEEISEEELIQIVSQCNTDNSVDGIIVQLPLPSHIDEDIIINSIDPKKDVDGLTSVNFGNLADGKDCFVPCTAKAVMEMFEVLDEDLKGKKVTILGRSKLVGLPLFHLLLQKNAVPTICHTSMTEEDRLDYMKNADIIISAAGAKEPFITADMVKEGSVIIDVSIERNEEGKLHGDVCYDDVCAKAKYVSKVPMGVGQLTVLSVIENVCIAALKKEKLEKAKTKVPFLFE